MKGAPGINLSSYNAKVKQTCKVMKGATKVKLSFIGKVKKIHKSINISQAKVKQTCKIMKGAIKVELLFNNGKTEKICKSDTYVIVSGL